MICRGQHAAIFGCAGTALGASEAAFFAECQPFGFILFARNVGTPDQLLRLTGDLRAAVGRDAPIFVDQEGGRVQRLRAPHWREWTPPLDFATAAGANAARAMELRYRLIARELHAVGITGNCAPSADIAGPQTHLFLRNRCYGDDPATVGNLATAAARGLMAEGVWPVVKHLPGHGRAQIDTHLALPSVDASREDLRANDFAPFSALAHLPFAMTAHIVFSAYDDRPATQSAPMINAIRNEIGFQGVLMTDDLKMQALGGDLSTRTRLALSAGCDLALHCNGDLAEMQAVALAAGPLRDDTLHRLARIPAMLPAPDPIDSAALDAELATLMT